MSSRLSDAIRRLPALSPPRRRRIRKPIERPIEARQEPRPRPARAPYVLTLSSRRIARRTLPEAVVPYLRMSGRWLEEHGFAIGSGVQVVIEYGRVTLLSGAAKRDDDAPGGPAGPGTDTFSKAERARLALNAARVNAKAAGPARPGGRAPGSPVLRDAAARNDRKA